MYVLFMFELDDECKIINTKALVITEHNKYVLGYYLGWTNMMRYTDCLRKGINLERISLITYVLLPEPAV